jgi:hypothetical protein
MLSILSSEQIQAVEDALFRLSENEVTKIEHFCEQLSNPTIPNEDKLEFYKGILLLMKRL